MPIQEVLEISSIDGLSDYQPAFEWLSEWIEKYPIVLLYGDLGAGKTTFVQAFCLDQYGIKETSSPTYAIINMYKGAGEVAHADLYRLESTEELVEIGFEDLLDLEVPTFIEWPELALPLIGDHIEVCMKVESASQRSFRARVIRE